MKSNTSRSRRPLLAVVPAVLLTLLLDCPNAPAAPARSAAADPAPAAAVSNHLAAIVRAGEPVDLESVAALHPKVPAGQNAAVDYSQAFAAIAGEPGSPRFLARNREAVDLLIQAAQRTTCRYPLDFRRGMDLPLPHLPKIKLGARLLREEAVRQAQAGDASACTAALLAGIRLARSVEDEPTLPSGLTRLSALHQVILGLAESLAACRFTDQQLMVMQAALGRVDVNRSLRSGLMFERAIAIDASRQSPAALLAWFKKHDASATNELGPAAVERYLSTPLRDLDLGFALESYAALLEALKQPLPQALRHPVPPLAETLDRNPYPISDYMVRPLDRLRVRAADAEAELRLARTMLAVERFRRTHEGAPPTALAELVPNAIQELPSDPYDGNPLRYRLRPGRGYQLYSIGRNLRDDGGTRAPKPEPGAADDIILAVDR